jgi:hypothetical protein
MIPATVDMVQRRAAKGVGAAYLCALVPAIFAEFFVSSQLIVYGNAAETAKNIISHERLFRLGIASNLLVFAIDGVLIAALYIVLSPVNRTLALLATIWRIIETTILVAIILNDFDALRVLSHTDALRAFSASQLDAMASMSIGSHGTGYNVGLFFAGIGSTAFCYLWLKSSLIPRPLALLGIGSSLLLALRTFAVIVFPEFANIATIPYYGGPIFIFELTMGVWLLVKGIKPR